MKKQPFQESVLNPEQLQTNMRQARAEAEQNVPDEAEAQESEGAGSTDEKKAARAMSRN
jgi:magnesium chelatase subunit I